MNSELRPALLFLVSAALSVPPLAAQINNAGISEGPELVGSGENLALRFPVVHAHRMTYAGCFGYLYFTRDKIRYEVIRQQHNNQHGFELLRADLEPPHRWTKTVCVTYDFTRGGKYHFCLISKQDVEDGLIRQFLHGQPLLDIPTKFDQVLADMRARAQAREERLKPPPVAPPTLSLLEPSDAGEGRTVEASGNLLRVRGVASHARGIASVSVNGQVAYLKQLAPQTVEFDARDLPVAAGTNAVLVLATSTDRTTAQMIFKVARPEVRVLDPASGHETQQPTVHVRGVASGFREVERVEIAGIRANLTRRQDGSTEFEAEKVPLNAVGMNSLEGFAAGASGVRERFTVEVKRKPPRGPPLFTLEDIVDMLQGEIAPARIVALVSERGVDFVLTEETEQRLRANGADSELLLAIAKAKK